MTEARLPSSLQAGRAKSATNYYTVPGFVIRQAGTAAITANTIYYCAIWTPTPIGIDQLACEITTSAAAGKLIRLGVFACDGDLQPTTLIGDTGDLAADIAPGMQQATVTATIPVGHSLFAWTSDGAPTLRMMQGSFMFPTLATTLGASPCVSRFQVARTYAALSGTITAWTTVVGGTSAQESAVVCRITVP